MKALGSILLNSLLSATAVNTFRRGLPTRQRYRGGQTTARTITNNQRRNRRRRNNGIEINKAIGGSKRIAYTGRVIEQTVNFYTKIHVTQEDKYSFTEGTILDITSRLNDEQEFLDLRKRALQFKVVQISINFNYNFVPQGGQRFPKIILNPETDNILRTEDPQKNRNAMVWDMTQMGNKNFNFRISAQNTDMEHREWINGDEFFNGVCKVEISGVSDPEAGASNLTLGDVKISAQVLYRPVDTVLAYRSHPSKNEMFKYIEELMKKEKSKELTIVNEITE